MKNELRCLIRSYGVLRRNVRKRRDIVNGRGVPEPVNGIEMKAPTAIVVMTPKAADDMKMVMTEVENDLVIGRGREHLNHEIGIMIGTEDTETAQGVTRVAMNSTMVMEKTDLKDAVRRMYNLEKEKYNYYLKIANSSGLARKGLIMEIRKMGKLAKKGKSPIRYLYSRLSLNLVNPSSITTSTPKLQTNFETLLM